MGIEILILCLVPVCQETDGGRWVEGFGPDHAPGILKRYAVLRLEQHRIRKYY